MFYIYFPSNTVLLQKQLSSEEACLRFTVEVDVSPQSLGKLFLADAVIRVRVTLRK